MSATKIVVNGETVEMGDRTDFTVDDTLTMSGENVLGVTNPTRCVTKSQFDVMSAEEKKGIVVVEDEDPPLVHHPGEIYSTKETVIGRWIDGKPIYRIANRFQLPEKLNIAKMVHPLIDDLGEIIDMYAIVERSAVGTFHKANMETLSCLYNTGASDVPYGFVVMTSDNNFLNKSGLYVLEYTKTTDEGSAT